MDLLPNEILFKILAYSGNYKNLSLVSKLLYHSTKKLNEPFFWLKIDSAKLNDDELTESILQTTRRIKNIEINCNLSRKLKQDKVLDVLTQQSYNIRNLTLTGAFYEDFLCEILNCIPNCNVLDLTDATIKRSNQKKVIKLNTSLQKVKKLLLPEAVKENRILELLKQKLKDGVLEELQIKVDTFNYYSIHQLIEKQPNLKIIKLKHVTGQPNRNLPTTFLSNCCKLETLEWDLPTNTDTFGETIITIFKRLKNLKVLKCASLWTELFVNIAHDMSDIETLEITTINIDHGRLRQGLLKFTKLRSLGLNLAREAPQRIQSLFAIFINLKLLQLETLKINHRFKIRSRCIQNIASPYFNLRKLDIKIGHKIDCFFEVLINFRWLESLTIGLSTQHSAYHQFIFRNLNYPDDIQNLNLKELAIQFDIDCSTPPIRQICENYPNIEYLSLTCLKIWTTRIEDNFTEFKFIEISEINHTEAKV